MTGVILAGGNGGRLKEITFFKPGALVGDKPMINHPLETLKDMGCDDALIVTNNRGRLFMPGFLRYEFPVSYAIQEQAKGMSDAVAKSEGHTKGTFPVIAGDFYFDPAPEWFDRTTLFWSRCKDPRQFGIYDPNSGRIVEKPVQDIGNMAIVACYIYDQRVYEGIKTLKPSERGELEITDLNNWYLEHGAQLVEYTGFWGDCGTPEGLKRINNYIGAKNV